MSTAIATMPPKPLDPAVIASVLLTGDLEKLNDQQRMSYCTRVCESLGLNAMTQPFAFIKLNGKLVMYAKKDATEQLRKIHGVSITSVSSQRIDDVFVVTANAQDRVGRTDAATGAVAIGSLKGEPLANALMKAETKAKRRVTLSICGLGMLDETEAEQFQPPAPVEAPPTASVALPEGSVRIMKVEPIHFRGASWADVTFVTSAGEEKTLSTEADSKDGSPLALFTELVQKGDPVWLTTKVTPRSKKTVINQVLRQPPTDAELDAEIVAKEAEVL